MDMSKYNLSLSFIDCGDGLHFTLELETGDKLFTSSTVVSSDNDIGLSSLHITLEGSSVFDRVGVGMYMGVGSRKLSLKSLVPVSCNDR